MVHQERAPMPVPLKSYNDSHDLDAASQTYAAHSAPQRDPASYYLSPPKSSAFPVLQDPPPDMMGTPHRGLPPPAAMDRLDRMDRLLPQPQPPTDRHQAPAVNGASSQNALVLGQLPNAPQQWTGQDESMRSWLSAKSEEDRRKQEEEKTRQEGLKLEQRKIEQNMLTESLRGGIPPPMVPMVFASMGGANVANMSVEWAQHYMTQMSLQQQQQQQAVQQQQQTLQLQHQQLQQAQQQQQLQQQQQQQQGPLQIESSPEQRREGRQQTGPQPNPYAPQAMQPPGPAAGSAYPPASVTADRTRQASVSHGSSSGLGGRAGNVSGSGTLSRLNTNELQIHPPSAAIQGLHISGGPAQPSQHAQGAQMQPEQTATASPTIYFHHYVPPGSQSASKDKGPGDPGTPAAGKNVNTSPQSQASTSHLRSDYPPSPKKRKVTGEHKAPPEPSPSFSQNSSSSSREQTGPPRRHRSRQPSDASARGQNTRDGPSYNTPSNSEQHDYGRHRNDSARQSFSESNDYGNHSGRNSAQPECRSYHTPSSSSYRGNGHHTSDGHDRRDHRRDDRSPKHES